MYGYLHPPKRGFWHLNQLGDWSSWYKPSQPCRQRVVNFQKVTINREASWPTVDPEFHSALVFDSLFAVLYGSRIRWFGSARFLLQSNYKKWIRRLISGFGLVFYNFINVYSRYNMIVSTARFYRAKRYSIDLLFLISKCVNYPYCTANRPSKMIKKWFMTGFSLSIAFQTAKIAFFRVDNACKRFRP